MDLPNELIIQILGNLPDQDVKQARLVCRQLAGLGLKVLDFKTVHISPRDKDMEVFDGITQHPILSQSVRHVVYDLAQFVNLRQEQYFLALFEQIGAQRFFRNDHGFQALEPEYTKLDEKMSQQQVLALFRRDLTLTDGLVHHKILVREQRNLFSKRWFARARKGLEAIGTLESVTIACAWRAYFIPYAFASTSRENEIKSTNDSQSGLLGDWHDDDDDCTEKGNVAMQKKDIEEEEAVYVEVQAFIDADSDAPSKLGTPPVARSWPLTRLLPYTMVDPSANPGITQLRKLGISDGSFEAFKVIHLLRSARKQPSKLVMPDGTIPPAFWNLSRWPVRTQLNTLLKGIQVLEIELADNLGAKFSTGDVIFCLDGLQALFRDAPVLRTLSLVFPFEICRYRNGIRFYDYHQVFPPVTEWWSLHLTSLRLRGLSASYRELVTLLFLGLPRLKHLDLCHLILTDGNWDNIVEGFRHANGLSSCEMYQLHYKYPDQEYITGYYHGIRCNKFYDHCNRYINEGGRHPSLKDDEPDSASTKYLIRLNETLDELRQMRASASQNRRALQ